MGTKLTTIHRAGITGRRRKILIFLFATIIIAVVALQPGEYLQSDGDASRKYSPILAPGYSVLAVFTSDTTACMRPNVARVLLQAAADDGPSTFKIDAVRQALESLGRDDIDDWELDFTGPAATLEQITAINNRWNNQFIDDDCFQTGGPIQIQTPS